MDKWPAVVSMIIWRLSWVAD